MLFNFAVSVLVLGSAVSASLHRHLHERHIDDGFNALTKRQQFVPTTQTAAGETCADAFGAGYETCREQTADKNRLCYNPTAGQICCSASWACPSGSFCLTNSNCCPTGLDPKTCAASNGIDLPDSYTTSAASAAPKETSTTANSTSVSATSLYVAPYPTANATAVVGATVTGSSGVSGYATSAVAFPGAASHASIDFGLAAAGILGFMATSLL